MYEIVGNRFNGGRSHFIGLYIRDGLDVCNANKSSYLSEKCDSTGLLQMKYTFLEIYFE